MKDDLVRIKDINLMSKRIGRDVAMKMSIPLNELKNYIRPREIKAIIYQYCPKQNGFHMVNAQIAHKIHSEVKKWVFGIYMCKMAASGKIEAEWDSDTNSIVFHDAPNQKHSSP